MTSHLPNRLSQIRARTRVLSCVALFALALLQVSFAVHQFEHAFGDAQQSCDVCAQHERLDDIAFNAETQTPPRALAYSAVPHRPAPVVATPTCSPDARAPPVCS